MPARYTDVRHVTVGIRKFVVAFDAEGNPRSIKERKIGPGGYHHNASYWHAGHHAATGPDTFVGIILAAAARK